MSKEQITKIAKLVALRRQQEQLTKEAGMQKTAVSAFQIAKLLKHRYGWNVGALRQKLIKGKHATDLAFRKRIALRLLEFPANKYGINGNTLRDNVSLYDQAIKAIRASKDNLFRDTPLVSEKNLQAALSFGKPSRLLHGKPSVTGTAKNPSTGIGFWRTLLGSSGPSLPSIPKRKAAVTKPIATSAKPQDFSDVLLNTSNNRIRDIMNILAGGSLAYGVNGLTER